MKFLLAMHSDFGEFQRMTPDEGRAFEERLGTFNQGLRNAGAWVSAAGVDEKARTIRFAGDSPSVTDGPFADTPERLAGYWIIEAPDFDAAVEWARKGPLRSGAIEIRPVVGD